jgi:hypothetical protein
MDELYDSRPANGCLQQTPPSPQVQGSDSAAISENKKSKVMLQIGHTKRVGSFQKVRCVYLNLNGLHARSNLEMKDVGLEVITAVVMKICAFWYIMPFSPLNDFEPTTQHCIPEGRNERNCNKKMHCLCYPPGNVRSFKLRKSRWDEHVAWRKEEISLKMNYDGDIHRETAKEERTGKGKVVPVLN